MKTNNTVLFSALLMELGLSVTQAAAIAVDGTSCVLADAISSANTDTAVGGCVAGSGADELLLPLDASITLTEALPAVTTEVIIAGNNATIERDLSSQTFRILTVTGGSLTLRDTTVTQGDVTYALGGTAPYNIGAGVQVSSGILNIERSTISNNRGGGVLFQNSTGTITDSIINENYGFAVSDFVYGAGVTVNCSDVIISRSTIERNTTSAFPGGAGIIQSGSCGTTLDINNSTISDNFSRYWGGGVFSNAPGATLNLSQVTVTKNVCNLAGYSRGCGMNSFNTTTNVSQSLFSGNKEFTGIPHEINANSEGVTVDDFSIIGLNQFSGSYGLTGGNYIIPSEVDLAEIIDPNLNDNGGLTPTHALNLNGPAIDVIPSPSCDSATDQTNKTRPLDALGSGIPNCDIGAYEASPEIIFSNGFELNPD